MAKSLENKVVEAKGKIREVSNRLTKEAKDLRLLSLYTDDASKQIDLDRDATVLEGAAEHAEQAIRLLCRIS